MEEVAPGEYSIIRPPAGEAWTIQNIYTEDSADLLVSDGIYDILIADIDTDEPRSMGFLGGFSFQLVIDHFLKVRNTDDATHPVGYGGKWALAFSDIVHDIRSLADDETMSIKPSTGSYIIQNIYLEDTANVEFTNGVDSIIINRNNETTSILCGNYECDITRYLQITNISGNEAIFGYDGFKI